MGFKVITLEQLGKIMPFARGRANRFIEPLNVAMQEFNIVQPLDQAAFLAQIAHESGQFRYMEELADGSAYEHRSDLGNTLPEAIQAAAAHGSTPGRFYKGHGPIQTTGYINHKACGEALRIDLVNYPRLITEPLNGCRSAAWFWQRHGLTSLALRGPSAFPSVTHIINGGYTHEADREAFYAVARQVLGC